MKIGIDILDIEKVRKIKTLNSFLAKNFDEKEIEYINAKNKSPQTIAGIFCVKEAVLKAFEKGLFDIPLKDIIVLHKESGAPYIEKNEIIKENLDKINACDIQISISHSDLSAIAICRID